MPRYDLLSLDLALGEDGRLSADVGGVAGSEVKALVDGFLKSLNALKVVARRDGANVYNLYNPPQPSAAGVRALSRKIKEILYGHVFPATVNIAVTSHCQCRCEHCSAELFQRSGRDPRPDLSSAEIRTVVREGLDLGANIIIFTGGEPLLRPDLPDLVRAVDPDKAVSMIFTNGWHLDAEKARALKEAGLYSLNVSVDDADPAVHDGLRHLPGCFERAFEGLRNALDAGILAGVSTYATSENLRSGRLEALLARARDEGAVEVTIFDCIPSGKLLWHEEMMLTEEDRDAVKALAKRFRDGPGSMGVIAMSEVNSPSGAGCFGGFSQVYVTCHGDVNPCDFNPVSFGSVREFPLAAIWEKMVRHPEFGRRQMCCRMQSGRYRARYIEAIPTDIRFPVPIEALPGDGRFLHDAYERFLQRMDALDDPGTP